jgi:hypothetical protein
VNKFDLSRIDRLWRLDRRGCSQGAEFAIGLGNNGTDARVFRPVQSPFRKVRAKRHVARHITFRRSFAFVHLSRQPGRQRPLFRG